MKIPLELKGFEGRDLYLKTATLLTNPRIFLDGKEVKKIGKARVLEDNSGEKVIVHIRYNYIDPVPQLEVQGETITLKPLLKRHEYMWICMPFLMMVQFELTGLLVGYIFAVYNAVLFRSLKSKWLRYILTAILTFAGFALLYYVK